MDPQTPPQPNVEPTPASPAPTQTAPVTPAPPQQPAPPPAPAPPSPAPFGNKKLLAAIVAAVVIIAGLIFLFLSPWSPFASAVPAGPSLLVGKNKYINACNVVDKGLVAKQLELQSDANRENSDETFAFAPANTTDKEIDLLKDTSDKSVINTCTLKLDRIQEGEGEAKNTSFLNVAVTLEEFADESAAKIAFVDNKNGVKNAKTLPAFKDTSYYGVPAPSSSSSVVKVQPHIVYKNLLISISAPIGKNDASGEKNAAKLETVVKDMMSRIDKGNADKPKNYNAINKLGGNAFIDACRSVNYVKVAKALGNGTDLNPRQVYATQAYAPDDNSGTTPKWMTSACSFAFRTQTEIDNAKGITKNADGKDLTDEDKYPHFLSIQIAVTENKDKAQEFLKAARTQAQTSKQQKGMENTTVEDIKLGDGGLKVALKQEFPAIAQEAGPLSSFGQLYYITNGANVYIMSATYSKRDKPFKTDTKEISLEQATKIYKELTLASKRAN